MRKRQVVGPSYAELRPVKGKGATFPVYDDLVEQLCGVERGAYDKTAAHVCAVAAGWAYSGYDTVAMMLARLGLEENRCAYLGVRNDAMFIASSAFVVQSQCGRVVLLAYRGTEPRNFINWMTNADVSPTKLPFRVGDTTDPNVLVHGGFFRNMRATWHQVVAALLRAADGRSVFPDATDERVPHPMEALYVTGHSLGAAMAALASIRLVTDKDYARFSERLRGVYTYGQPMVGTPAFADACRATPFLAESVFRHVYKKDIVPRLPPAVADDFEHFGPEFRVGDDGRWLPSEEDSEQATELIMNTFVIPAISFVSEQLAWTKRLHFSSSWYDHSPTFYIDASTPEGVGSEFERVTKRPTAPGPDVQRSDAVRFSQPSAGMAATAPNSEASESRTSAALPTTTTTT